MTKDSRQPTNTAHYNVLHRLDKLIDRAQTRIYWCSVEQEKDIYKTEDKSAVTIQSADELRCLRLRDNYL
jgi:hypothetical protein